MKTPSLKFSFVQTYTYSIFFLLVALCLLAVEYWLPATSSGILPLSFLVVALVLFPFEARKWLLKKKMIITGTKISAKVISIDRQNFFYLLIRFLDCNLPRFNVIAEWQDPKDFKVYTFKSETLFHDPYLRIGVGSQVDVYIDRSNPTRYYMDVLP